MAENFDQLDVIPNYSRLSRRKRSDVVPECIYAFCNVSARCGILSFGALGGPVDKES